MKRRSVIVIVVVSISIVGLTMLILVHPKNGGPTSPEAERNVKNGQTISGREVDGIDTRFEIGPLAPNEPHYNSYPGEEKFTPDAIVFVCLKRARLMRAARTASSAPSS